MTDDERVRRVVAPIVEGLEEALDVEWTMLGGLALLVVGLAALLALLLWWLRAA